MSVFMGSVEMKAEFQLKVLICNEISGRLMEESIHQLAFQSRSTPRYPGHSNKAWLVGVAIIITILVIITIITNSQSSEAKRCAGEECRSLRGTWGQRTTAPTLTRLLPSLPPSHHCHCHHQHHHHSCHLHRHVTAATPVTIISTTVTITATVIVT
uniref:Uncharacterized protein n=1 Tax=Rangifer tarandus platyrhynchus TaxID=3082113 RepID=A0ACB0FJ21_RANTA|nr:unnamed protein product [Rangifer tarandus platyrhynchus]